MKLPLGSHFLSSLIADILGVKYDHFYDQSDQSSKGKKQKRKKAGVVGSSSLLFLGLSGPGKLPETCQDLHTFLQGALHNSRFLARPPAPNSKSLRNEQASPCRSGGL